jgi:hypothetical protein
MQFLIVCDHRKAIIEHDTALAARDLFRCKSCVRFDLKNSRWIRKDLRVYLSSQRDVEIVMDQQEPEKKTRITSTDQMDWVSPI